MNPDKFRQIAGHWLTGVAVVTTVDGDGHPAGLTMNAVTSLSLNPPQFLICIDKRSPTLAAISAKGVFCINYLRHDQQAVAVAFASRNGDRFSTLKTHTEKTGSPVLDDAIAYVECKVHAIHAGGDHSIIIGDAIAGEAPGGEPLVYHRSRYLRLTP